MKIVVQVKLLPPPDVAAALGRTLHACNNAANLLSARAHEQGEFSRKALQGCAYHDLKERGLSAQPALHVLRKVADAYTTLHANIRAGNLGKPGSLRRANAESAPVVFRADAAQPFDDRCLSWQVQEQTVSIWTTSGRMRGIRFVCSGQVRKLLAEYRRGESDLVYRDGLWLLIATCEVPEADPIDPVGFIGVDLGIANIATTSTGYRAVGRGLNRHRQRQRELRSKLQAKGTKSAKRRLKHRRRKERRHAANINHIISKRIVTEAQRTSRGIALEDLGGIQRRVRLRKPQRVTFHCWAFAQLGRFLEYKARRAGVPLIYVDPAFSSQECADCHHIDKKNRVDQARFVCRGCGVVAHADRNASHNLAHRGEVAWNAGRESRVPDAP